MSARLDAARVQEIFDQALECDSRSRDELLSHACGDNSLMRQEVESLLRSFDEHQDFLQSPVFNLSAAEVIARVLDESEKELSVVGQRVGPYRLVRQIGRGGMGAVYLAERDDSEYRKQVAIKLIRKKTNLNFVSERFRRERQILADLDHPNIARLIDGGTSHNGLPYLVMEYVDGVPIDQYSDNQSLSISQRLELFREVCSAVAYAHQRLIIHRDIKPSNILVNEDGTPKLLDFGIAKLLDPSGEANQPEASTALQVMTPEYASPEQVTGKPITVASDIYSLGIVLYEVLTGQRPYKFTSNHPNEVARIISTQRPEKPSTAVRSTDEVRSHPSSDNGRGNRRAYPQRLGKKLRGDLDTIVLTALRKEPERRYRSVEQFSEDIRRHLSGLPIIARKDSWTYRTGKFLKRNRTLVTTTAVAALICLILGSAFTFFSVRARPKTSVAVLDFMNTSGDPNMDYLSNEVKTHLEASLSRVPRLRIAAANSSFAAKNANVPDAEQLGVEAVLKGGISADVDNILINITLYDRGDDQPVWNKQYKTQPEDMQATEWEIARDVSLKLGFAPGDDSADQRRRRGTDNVKAYELYLLGRSVWNKRTPQSLSKAIECFQQATQEDSHYALAYSGLANSYSLLGAYKILPPDETFSKAKAAATRALEFDQSLPEGHNAMALIKWLYDWDWDGADNEFRRAIELNPRYSLAHHWYGLFLAEMGRADESIAEEKRALELEPISAPVVADLGRVYFFARRYDQADEQFEKAAVMTGPFGDVEINRRMLYEQTGNAKALIRFVDDRELIRALVAENMTAYRRRLKKLYLAYPATWNAHYGIAEILARLGENDSAINELNLAYQAHDHVMTQLKVNPAFDSLRSDPQFIELLHRMNLN